MLCPKCGFENPSDAKYCQKCANVFSSHQNLNHNSNINSDIQTMPREFQSEKNQQANSLIAENYGNNQQTNVVPLPRISHLLSNTFHLIKTGFWRFLLINFLSIALPFIIMGFGLLILNFFAKDNFAIYIILPIIFFLIILFSFPFGFAAMINLSHSLKLGERKIQFKKSLAYIFGLIVFGIAFGFLLNIGFLFFIIPGVILMIKYFLTPYVYCLEEKNIFHAFGKASDYTDGYRYSLLTRIILFVFVWYVVYMVLFFVFAIVGFTSIAATGLVGVGLFGQGAMSPSMIIIGLLIGFLFLVFISLINSFQITYFYNVFDGLKKIKQKAQQENRQVIDGYTLKKKILIFLPVILIIVLMAVTVVQGFKQTKNLDTNLLNNQQENELNLEKATNLNSDNSNLSVYIPSIKKATELIKLKDKNFVTKDTDSDGLIDFREYTYFTLYNNEDSDMDGYLDGEEIQNGYNPKGQGNLEVEKIFDCNNRTCLITAATNCNPVRFREATSSPDGTAFMEVVVIGKEDSLCKFTDYREIHDEREDSMIVQTAGICWYDNEFMKNFGSYLNQNIEIRPDSSEVPDKNFCEFTVNFSTKQKEDNPPEDLTESANLQVYQNDRYGFEFIYPREWSAPILEEGDWSGGGSYTGDENSKWRLNIGDIAKGFYEGSGYYRFYLDGYSVKDYDTVINDLKSNSLVRILKQNIINESSVVVYSEGGICADKVAFIFNKDQTIKFTGHCVIDAGGSLEDRFDQILSTFKFLD